MLKINRGALIQLMFALTFAFACKTPKSDENIAVHESIRVNQVGFYPQEQKMAVVLNHENATDFTIWSIAKKEVVFEGKLGMESRQTLSGHKARTADFTDLAAEGKYELMIDGLGKSYPFEIKNEVNAELGKSALKAFYFQRASTTLDKKEAGVWARKLGHPDDQVMVHPSAAASSRAAGTIISSPFGWYDAGDYNKYIVNSGVTVGTLLSLYEDFPHYFQSLDLNIPESGDQVPDLLDEVNWNLIWMLSMQDPNDGGVYHKLTTASFAGMVAPHLAVAQRYVVQKSTAATLDFAAVMAQASRVYKEYSPEKSITYLKAAEKAWSWAKSNPAIVYEQNQLNKDFEPDIVTGAYGDQNLQDEWIWAAAELYVSTHNLVYWEELESADQSYVLPSWSQVSWLGYYTLLRHQANLGQLPQEWMSMLKINMLEAARSLVNAAVETAYRAPMGTNVKDFVWGSNAVAANQGILLLYAYKYSLEKPFLSSALDNLDYVLGRNATGYSFVTGFGGKTPLYPHHRLATSRPELPPLPGFIVGGPNPGQQDDCNYPSSIPDESFTDESCSYASNEIAINWNAPFAYLVNALEAIHGSF